MNITDLQQKSISELHGLLAEKRNELREMRFKVHGGQLKQIDKIKKVRQDIARILTIINAERHKAAAPQAN